MLPHPSDNLTLQSLRNLAAEFLKDPLEIDLLLSKVLNVDRVYLYTWPEKTISLIDQQLFYNLLYRRMSGEPLAYIVEEKEFWSLPLKVDPNVLIPRPDTELIVECVLKLIPKDLNRVRILELGTGSGAIALALAKERPHWKIVATDNSPTALEIAKQNAKNLSLSHIEFYLGNWFGALDPLPANEKIYNFVVSNPPYIAIKDPHLSKKDLQFEPLNALVSGVDGLKDLKHIIKNSASYLASNGYIIVEHGYAQCLRVKALMRTQGYIRVTAYKDLANVNRVTVGKKP